MMRDEVLTVEQLMTEFSDTIANIGVATTHEILSLDDYRALRNASTDLHHIWLAVLDLVADAYSNDDLVVIR